ncbi:hypothetical protein BJ322DRAFT_1127321 [Thelephora terrestris]|uniref:Uncharacterized protein n=1 Tax=Thelephora terrestris TaxID=56493 RepID=A0A9P6HBH7_9AGAM|nr:hypothetical protein BJ322DRAFT_1127321 [Thelephora terrestris]
MQCHGWSTTIRSLRLSALRSTFAPKPARNVSRFTFPTRPAVQSRSFRSAALANASGRATRRIGTGMSPKLSPAALARAASQTIRMCGKEKQFGDALYILNSMRFSIFPPSSNPPPKFRKRDVSSWVSQPKLSQFLSSTPSSIEGYTFIDFGRPVPTRLASHSFLHSLVKAGLPTKAAAQAKLMMADGIRIRTKTMESILASTVDQCPYPPVWPLKVASAKTRLNELINYPIADQHTRIAVRLLEEARHRRQERTQHMYDVVINACLLQGEIIVASLLFIMVIKDWQLRRSLKDQCSNNPPPEPSEPFITPSYPNRQTHWSLLDRIEHTLTSRKDPQDPSFRNAIQALANLAFAVDTGRLPSRFMASLIKALQSVPKSPAIVYIGSPEDVRSVNAYEYIHQVLMRLVCDAGRKLDRKRDPIAERRYNVHAYNALLHYCLHHRLSKAHASDLLEVMQRKRWGMTLPAANVLLRNSTLLRDDTIRMDSRCFAHTAYSTPIGIQSSRRAKFPLTRWAHIVNVLKLEFAMQNPSEPVIRTPAAPDPYTVSGLITHLTATDRGHIVAEKLTEIIPELYLVDEDGSRIPLEERGRCAVPYGPYFFSAVLNALGKGGRAVEAERVWRLAVEAEKASWTSGSQPWFLPIHAYTCMLQLHSRKGKVGKVTAPSWRNRGHGGIGRGRRRTYTETASAMAKGQQVFRAVQVRCQFLETVRDDVPSRVPPSLRKFAPDERYFNALLDLYGRRTMGYPRPTNNRRSYWKWLEKLAGKRFAASGKTTGYWHPKLAEIIAEMHKYGYKVPEGLRFLLVGRASGVGTGDSEPLRPIRPGPLPRRNPQRIPVFKTRGLPLSRGKPRGRVQRGV